jgi:hypothetical protein
LNPGNASNLVLAVHCQLAAGNVNKGEVLCAAVQRLHPHSKEVPPLLAAISARKQPNPRSGLTLIE